MKPCICRVNGCAGCLVPARFSLMIITIMILIMTLAVHTISAGCTLQLHGYDAEGDGWENTTISIKVGDEFIIEDWFVANSAHEFVEFYVEPVEIEIQVYAGDDRLDNYFRLTDQQGYTLYRPPKLQYTYIDLDVCCDLMDLKGLLRCMPARQNDESVCWDGYIDETNGGCDAQNPLFDTIQCGEVVCGTLGIYITENQKISDSDWYEFHLDSYSDLQITAS
ncbi:hypothetical protein K8T06_07155, partial [bacterium]|nr:hypothetical protein [bacterium]